MEQAYTQLLFGAAHCSTEPGGVAAAGAGGLAKATGLSHGNNGMQIGKINFHDNTSE
ncbi:hypothetical protein QCD60_09060 [Pokkaliibacter sp. MBI-7]|uniref:hypothetical protein n=1 Tax=Pokkaliibacter sp. MBI-7 TaxID=3040600 RepID=UPI00244B8F27|nr:hypothetical protein [Pokkaliibacter sp. MBI-7]MDH2432714.1 hypothetical protein [Pokkaliibacter sp. MBI-7]